MPYADIEKRRKYHREYYYKNKHKLNARTKVLRCKNRDYINTRQRAYWHKNRERILQWRAEYRCLNKIRISGYHKKYRENNQTKIKQFSRNFKLNHPDRVRANSQIQKANRKNAGVLTKHLLQQVYENNIKKYGTLTCVLCNKMIRFGEDSLEHLTPICKGGKNTLENLNISHRKCNLQKGTKTFKEFKNVKS